MITTYGTQQRAVARLIVLRGWDPSNPTMRTRSAPVASGTTILSGQVISLQYSTPDGQEEWNLGVVSATDIPYFAVQDSDDYDPIASGVLTGLSSLDNIELQTGYFDASPSPSYGSQVALKASTVTAGNVTTAATSSTVTILGYTSRFNGPTNIQPTNSGVIPDGSGNVLVLTLMTGYVRNAAT